MVVFDAHLHDGAKTAVVFYTKPKSVHIADEKRGRGRDP